MAKRGYGYEKDNEDTVVDDPETLPAGAGTTTEKSATTAAQARAWWNTYLNTTHITKQTTYRAKFANPNAPTDNELIALYDEVYSPATPERAKEWWNGLNAAERKTLREQYVDAPSDDKLVTMYNEAHARTGESVEGQHTGDEIPTVQAATPGVSATNPDLMDNDAQPGVEDPFYAGSPRPPGWVPPEPPPEPPVARGTEHMRRS